MMAVKVTEKKKPDGFKGIIHTVLLKWKQDLKAT